MNHDFNSWKNNNHQLQPKNAAPMISTNQSPEISKNGSLPTKDTHSTVRVDTVNILPTNKEIKEKLTDNVERHGSKSNGKSLLGSSIHPKKYHKKKAFKPPKEKPNHKEPQYNYKKFPWNDLYKKADSEDSSVPPKFEANGPVRKIEFNSDAEITAATLELFEGEGIKSDFWKFFGVIKINPGNSLAPILGKLMQYRDDIRLGRDYVFHTREENHFGRNLKCHYFLFAELRSALVGAYLIGAEGDDLCPLVAISKNNAAFNEMFTFIDGQIDKMFVTYHDHKWHVALKKLVLEMKEDAALLTCGMIRNNLAELRYNLRKEAVSKGKVVLDVSQSFLDEYYPNKAHSLHFRSKDLQPRGVPRKVWAASFRSKHVLMLNSLNNPVKYFRNYDWDRAKTEATAAKELNEHERKGLSKDAAQIKKIDRAKTADDLRKIQMDNNFLRTNHREYKLHPRYSLLIGLNYELCGTMDDNQLRNWRLSNEENKQPISILNIKNQYDLAEWNLAQQLFAAGSKVNPDLIKFLYSMKSHHDQQYRKNAKEIAYVAAFAASNRNEMRHVNETVKLELQSVKIGIDLNRVERGLEPIYHENASAVTEAELARVERQVEDRHEMVNSRDGEFPCQNTAKQVLSGTFTNTFDHISTKNSICEPLGLHFRQTDGGFNEEELAEKEIEKKTFMDTKNHAYTNDELDTIGLESLEPRSKIRKESDKKFSLSEEKARDCSFQSDASVGIVPDMSLNLDNPEGSICNTTVATVKKPGTKRIQNRAHQIMKDLNNKIASGLPMRKKNKHINIGDNELSLITFKAEDFKELAEFPYISINGEVLHLMKQHDWSKNTRRGKKTDAAFEEENLHMRISLAEMRRTWFSITLMYSKGVIAILNAIQEINMKRTKDRLNHGIVLECAELRNDLEIFLGGLNDATWIETFSQRSDKGRAFCPLPTLLLYNTITTYLPTIKEKLNGKPKFRKYPNDDQLLRQMVLTHNARLELSPRGNFITNKDTSSRDLTEGRKISIEPKRNEKLKDATVENLNISDQSRPEINRSEYALMLNGAYDYEHYNEWLENNFIPLVNDYYERNPDMDPNLNSNIQNLSTDLHLHPINSPSQNPKSQENRSQLPKTSTPDYRPPRKEVFTYDASFIYAEEKKKSSKDKVKVSTDFKLELKAKEIFERPLGIEIDPNRLVVSEPIKDEYIPKFINEKVQFQFGDLIRRNPMLPGKNELELQFKNHKIRTTIDNDAAVSTPPKFYNLSITYCNINPPVQNRIKSLLELEPYCKSAFVCISEVRTKMDLILDLTVIPLGYSVFTHKSTNSGLCYSLILVKIDLPGSIEIVYSEAPIIIIRWKHERRSFLVGCVYRPHAKSVIYERDFTKDEFAHRMEDIYELCEKPAAVICGDFNLDFTKVVLNEDKKVRRLLERVFCRFEYLATPETFFRNKDAAGTTIDYIFFKNVPYVKHTLVNGRDLIKTDGHMIFNIEFNVSLNGIIGTTIIKTRPRLDPKVVSKLANSLYPGLKVKLDAAKILMFEKYKIPEGDDFGNPELLSFDDNDYCETAFEFFEEFFQILQPETEKKVNIYNYPSRMSNDLSNLKAIYSSLKIDLKSETQKDRRDCLKLSMKETNELIEQVKVRDKKDNLIGKINTNDDDFYAIVKALRPKLRQVQMTKELFTADQLAEEYRRVYSGITKHISESEVTLDILQLCPKISEALKFSFKDWVPSWNSNEACIKNISKCFNQLKAKTRGLNSSLYRDGVAMLPIEFIEIINNMILFWTKGGNYPKKFLGGKLKSILKKGDAKLIKNRRFISVGNFFQQLLGKVTASCVLAYCEFHKLLDDDQYGFRSFRSTDLAVAALHYKVASRNDLCTTILLFIDFSSAFFCVKKDLLTDILSTFMNKEAMIFFKNLLEPITATVISDGVESEKIEVPDFGVRQGGADSPLHFNLCQNMIFKYVSIPMDTRYDKKYLNLQGFADDSILIACERGKEKTTRLLESGLEKVVSYVTSVGFCINPSKSEAMIICKKKERGQYGDYLDTSQGRIKIKKSNNILGLRLHEKLNFKPQFTHLMEKIVRIKYDILDLLKIGTKRQLIKVAFSKCSGVYTYGIGVQKVWTKSQYSKAQKEVNDLIRITYDVKWDKENSWRQNDLLRMVDWPPVRLQHAKAALFTLNKVALNPSLEFLYDAVNHHLRYPDSRGFLENPNRIYEYEDDPLNRNLLPVLGLSTEDKRNMSNKVKHSFPLSVNHWFKDLPDFIKILIGTHEFYQAVQIFYKRACWHREEKDCSLCRYNKILHGDEKMDFEKLVNEYLVEEELTRDEFDSTFNHSYFENYEDTYLDEDDIDYI